MKYKSRGSFIQHDPCPSCDSSDAFAVYQDEKGDFNGTCFSCGHYERSLYKDDYGGFAPTEVESHSTERSQITRRTRLKANMLDSRSKEEVILDFLSYPIKAIPERLISQEACEHYNVRVSLSEQDGVTIITHKYPIYKRSKLSGYKERIVDTKQMFSKGDCKDSDLFGQNSCQPGGKVLFITEGEIDCLSLYDVLRANSSLNDWTPAVVSVSTGSKGAINDISRNIEFVESFQKIVLCFDMDEPGRQATEEVCKLLAGKVYVASYSEKDANEMVKAGKSKDLYWDVIKHAKKYTPDGIVYGTETWDRYRAKKQNKCYPYPASWTELNHMTYGVRLGSIVTVTSGSGMGKTQFLAELKDHFHRTTDFKFADISLEQDVGDTVGALMALHLNKRIQLPDCIVTEDEEREAHDFYFSSDRWVFYDHFGGMDDSNLFSKIRYFAATGCSIIYLDHLSIIVSEFASEGGERERIDTIMTKLAKLAKELQIVIFLVVHLRKSSDKGPSFEQGAVPSLDDLRGSGAIKQLSWDVIGLSRNQQHPSKFCANTTRITVLKCRFTGRTGESDYLHFSDETGRMEKVSKPAGYELKGSKNQEAA